MRLILCRQAATNLLGKSTGGRLGSEDKKGGSGGGGEEALWSHFVPIDAVDGQKKSFTSGHEKCT